MKKIPLAIFLLIAFGALAALAVVTSRLISSYGEPGGIGGSRVRERTRAIADAMGRTDANMIFESQTLGGWNTKKRHKIVFVTDEPYHVIRERCRRAYGDISTETSRFVETNFVKSLLDELKKNKELNLRLTSDPAKITYRARSAVFDPLGLSLTKTDVVLFEINEATGIWQTNGRMLYPYLVEVEVDDE
jgi:hypothetical protein